MAHIAHMARVAMYIVTSFCTFTLGIWLVSLKNEMARLFGVAMFAWMVNDIFMLVLAVQSVPTVADQLTWVAGCATANAIIQAITSVILLFAFTHIEGNGEDGNGFS